MLYKVSYMPPWSFIKNRPTRLRFLFFRKLIFEIVISLNDALLVRYEIAWYYLLKMKRQNCENRESHIDDIKNCRR